MNIPKIRALADYIEKNRRTFSMGDSNRCIVGFGLKMDGKMGFYEVADGIVEFARRFDMPRDQVISLYVGSLHGLHRQGPAGSAALLRELADQEEAKLPKKIPIEVRSVGPVALTVAVRVSAPERELVPA